MFRFIGPQNPTRSLGLCRVVWNNMRRLFQNRKVFADFEIGAAADLFRQRLAFRRLHAQRADAVVRVVAVPDECGVHLEAAAVERLPDMGRNTDAAERDLRADALNFGCGCCGCRSALLRDGRSVGIVCCQGSDDLVDGEISNGNLDVGRQR